MRGLNITAVIESSSQDADVETSDEEGDSSSGDEDKGNEEAGGSQVPIAKSVTMGLMQMVDGELLIQTTDFADVDDLFGELDGNDSGEEDD